MTPTSTGCLTPASGITPTPTTATGSAAAQASGSANHLVISEIRTCGPNGGGDEFVELFNPTGAAVSLDNWQLRVSDASGVVTTLITFSANTTLNAGQHLLVAGTSYSGAVKPDFTFSAQIPDDGGVALVQPDNGSADQVGMSAGSAFKEGAWLAPLSALASTSYERKLGGSAGNCVDTDNNANDFSSAPGNPQDLASAPTVCASANTPGNLSVSGGAQSNFFIDNIQKPPTDFGPHAVAVLVTNILLALILTLIMSVASTILNDTLEANEAELLRFFGPIVALFGTLGRWLRAFDAKFDKHRIAWVGALLKLAVMLLLYGIIFAYLDPSFNLFSATGWLLILGMTISVGFISIVDDIAQFLFLRQHGESASLRVHSANLVLAGVSTGFSRFVGLTPGIIFGSPAGIEDVESTHHESSLHLIAIGATGLAALIAWLLSPLATQNVWLTTVLLLTFSTGLQTIFFEMLPVRYLHGRGIFERSKVLWVVLFVIIAAIFMQTMLNPNGDFTHAFESANMVTLAIVVGLFCAFTAVVWFYFGRKQNKAADAER